MQSDLFLTLSSNITDKVSRIEWDFRGTVENIYYLFPNIHDSTLTFFLFAISFSNPLKGLFTYLGILRVN